MNEDLLKNKIKKLELELELKYQEISGYLDKIDNLEEKIMEIEATISNSDKDNNSYFQFRLREMENTYRELKDKVGLLRLENIRLKQDLDKAKKNPILLPIVEEKKQNENLESSTTLESEDNNENFNQEEIIKKIRIICPECANQKLLKVPLKIINQSNNVTTISVPS
ncbi:MAG: hypothetical protein ACFFBZ_06510, partial [Promethearchaeota archaeon]